MAVVPTFFQENPLGGIEYAVAGFLGFLLVFLATERPHKGKAPQIIRICYRNAN